MDDLDKITKGLEVSEGKITGIHQQGSIATVDISDGEWFRVQVDQSP